MQYEFPPYLYLMQVAKNCHYAVETYMNFWQETDSEYKVRISKKNFQLERLLTMQKFKRDLAALVKEALINVKETPTKFEIELIAYDLQPQDHEEPKAC